MIPFGIAVTSMTASVATVRTAQGTTKAIALAIIFAIVYCAVDTGRLTKNSWTLSFRSWLTPLITRKMLRMTSVQMSDTVAT